MKAIALSQRVECYSERNERRDALDQRWARFLLQCGLAAHPIPNDVEAARVLTGALDFDGVLLTGGNDLVTYGGDAPERDSTERYLIEWARTRKKPLLGVCRGMQMIQHIFGVPLTAVEGHVGATHVLSGGSAPRVVNSFHRQGARASVEALEVVARSADGVIEAVKHRTENIAGLMWHPERCEPFCAEDVAEFRRFFAAGA